MDEYLTIYLKVYHIFLKKISLTKWKMSSFIFLSKIPFSNFYL